MPTGYTSVIEEGDGCSFEEFVWRCARAFGALIEMREDGMNVPVPETFEIDDWRRKSLAEDQARLAKLEAMTPAEIEKAAAEDHERRHAEWKKSEAKRIATGKRYREMTEKVTAWRPPTPEHERLRTFMLEQIRISFEPERKPLWEEPKPVPAKKWWREQREGAARMLKGSAENLSEAIERVNSRNRWVEALRESVPQPKRMRP